MASPRRVRPAAHGFRASHTRAARAIRRRLVALIAIAATSMTPYVIERMTDHGFRHWTRVVIFAISVVYLVRAGFLLWQ